jgi:hypothetical protein
MKNTITALIIGLVMGWTLSALSANKVERSSTEAAPIVGYGNYSGTIVPISVDASGVLRIN